MYKRLTNLLTRTEGVLENPKNNSNPKISYNQSVAKAEMDEWLRSDSKGSRNGYWRFNYGAEDLGSPWHDEIPVTPLLLAGLQKKKVKIWAEYNWSTLVGGFSLCIKKLETVTDKDLDGIIITRAQFDRHMREESTQRKKKQSEKHP